MITVDADVRRTDGVALVTGVIENDDDRERTVRVRATVPVMPPRRRGVPERGWDGRTLTVGLPPETTRGVGFATTDPSVTPGDPPLELVDRAVDDRPDPADLADPSALVRSLGESRPPADAVPREMSGTGADRRAGTDVDDRPEPPGSAADWEWVGDGECVERGPDEGAVDGDRRTESAPDGDGSPTPDAGDLPAPVADWLASVDRRCARVERTSADVPLSTATATLDDAGGLAGLTADLERLAADARRLRALADRAETLARRAEAADLPVADLEALA